MMYCVKSRWYRQSLLGASPSPARGAGAAGSGRLAAGSGLRLPQAREVLWRWEVLWGMPDIEDRERF